MGRSRWCDGGQVNVAVRLLATMLAMQLSCGAAMGVLLPGKFSKLFVFGDSYVGTGNRDPFNKTETPIGPVDQPWQPPYGKTRPGSPAGRFSDGYLLTDFLAGYLGLAPIPYRVYKANTSQSVKDGMNFAVGGSGEFDNLGFTKTSDQIREFQRLIFAGVYDLGDIVDESLILFSISGNDYASVTRNFGITGVPAFVPQLVAQIVTDLKSLYRLGFKKFAVAKLEQIACLPSETAAFNYTICNPGETPLATAHNTLLVANISASLPRADVIFLDNESAFDFVTLFHFGNFSNPLKPCCIPKTAGNICGDVDSGGNPLYTVCSDPSQAFFWDEHHLTEAGWSYIFSLFIGSPLFTGGRSLPLYLS